MENWRDLLAWAVINCGPEVLVWLAVINVVAFGMYGYDKRLAQSGHRRISESSLLQVAIFGGSLGANLACRVYRHKTRKQPFANRLQTITVIQLAIAIGLAIAFLPF